MTDEELDEARAREALTKKYPSEVWDFPAPSKRSALWQAVIEAARLAREGWVPVDPDLVEARAVVALLDPDISKTWRTGIGDRDWSMKVALAALKRGRELSRG